MKRQFFILGLLFVLVLALPVSAQEVVQEFPLGDVVVLCPQQQVPQAVVRAAQLFVAFTGNDDRIVIPGAQVVNNTLQITQIVLDCTADANVIAQQIDRSPSVAIGAEAPRPANEPGVAESQAGYLIVNTSAANLRSCDAPTCSRVAIVDGGTTLVVLGRNAGSSWWFVQAGDIRGWIWSGAIVARGDLSDVPVVATQGERTPPTVYIGYTGNPIYNELSTAGTVICPVQGGREYALVGRNADTSWLLIEATCTDGTAATGWINAQFVLIRNSGEVAVPVIQ